ASLTLEQLENRLVPASVSFYSGNLVITPSAGELSMNLALTQTAGTANKFSVTDHGSSVGTYSAVSNISVTATNGSDTVTLDLSGTTYTGSFLANTGNGNDMVSITSTGGAGAMLGNTLISSGVGNDAVNLNSTGTTAVTFGGSIQVTGTGSGG